MCRLALLLLWVNWSRAVECDLSQLTLFYVLSMSVAWVSAVISVCVISDFLH